MISICDLALMGELIGVIAACGTTNRETASSTEFSYETSWTKNAMIKKKMQNAYLDSIYIVKYTHSVCKNWETEIGHMCSGKHIITWSACTLRVEIQNLGNNHKHAILLRAQFYTACTQTYSHMNTINIGYEQTHLREWQINVITLSAPVKRSIQQRCTYSIIIHKYKYVTELLQKCTLQSMRPLYWHVFTILFAHPFNANT